MKRIFQTVFVLCLLLCGCRSTSRLNAVPDFDVNRYLGRWYEAARFPHSFEKGLTSVTADYRMNPDGSISVTNRGYNPESGEWEQADGVAKFKDDPNLGWLKVSFFGPFYATYKIIYLDDEYTKAIVTGPSYNYLWILVRDPDIEKSDVDRLAAMAASFGFDTNKLERIDQSKHRL